MYDCKKQFRCTIIRGKSQKEIDDLLPVYAKVIDDIAPCNAGDFPVEFNKRFSLFLEKDKRIKKTLDNHRTEIAGKLFGMYYEDTNGYIYASDRTKKFLEDNDQPAFFKDICYKMQFPNGMQKYNTIQELLDNEISIKPNAFVIKTLICAKEKGIILTKKEIGYYILNSLNVLQGVATPEEVLGAVVKDREAGISRIIEKEGKASSYNYQHINEQINYLELANLVYTNSLGEVWVNTYEKAVMLFAHDWNKMPEFDVYAFDMHTLDERKHFVSEWTLYFGKLSKKVGEFNTTAKALGVIEDVSKKKKDFSEQTTVDIGDEGEAFVFTYEKKRVSTYNKRLANKVLALGKTKGLGYDIQSVFAEDGEMSEFVKYIEVKSTKRVTEPDFKNEYWKDTLNITRNEWIAALQHKQFYSIYRVYFVRGKVMMYIIDNVFQKEKDKKINVLPLTYRVDFGNKAVDQIIINEVE